MWSSGASWFQKPYDLFGCVITLSHIPIRAAGQIIFYSPVLALAVKASLTQDHVALTASQKMAVPERVKGR